MRPLITLCACRVRQTRGRSSQVPLCKNANVTLAMSEQTASVQRAARASTLRHLERCLHLRAKIALQGHIQISWVLWLRQTARNVALAHILPPQERRQLLPACPAVLVHHHQGVTEAMTAERFVRRALSGCTQIAQPVPRANSKVKLCVRSAHVRTARPIRRATRVLPFAYATQVSAARMKGRVPAVPLVSTRACRDQQHVLHVKGARILQKVGQRSVGIAGGEHSWSSAAPPPPATVQRARAASIRMRLGLQAASRAVRVGTPGGTSLASILLGNVMVSDSTSVAHFM